ncbi:MAG: hypothetical protein H0U46_04920 [Actinobacteria bacterium]|nr:hypothetical protein [Actinomycetota bacterium]
MHGQRFGDPRNIPGAGSTLEKVGDDRFEKLANLRSPAAMRTRDDPNRVVARPREPELIGKKADFPPRLGHRELHVVERSGRPA